MRTQSLQATGTLGLKLQMLEQVLLPHIRHTMPMDPFTFANTNKWNSVIIKTVKRACGLSGKSSLILKGTPRIGFGLSVNLLHLTRARTLLKSIEDRLNGSKHIPAMKTSLLKYCWTRETAKNLSCINIIRPRIPQISGPLAFLPTWMYTQGRSD